MSKVFSSVILPVYDAPKSLSLVLEGYRRQSTRNFELIIADDGSPPQMKAIVQEFAKLAPFKVKYLWQKDKGYRKAKASNEGAKISEGNWLIFSDGDCIPHHNFVKSHINACKPKSVCLGLWIQLPLSYCKTLTADMVRNGDYEKFLPFYMMARLKTAHIRDILTGSRRFYDTTLTWDKHPITTFRDIFVGRRRSTALCGSNFSCSRELFYEVNGFDENMWNMKPEDYDIGQRIYRYGAKPIDIWHSAYVFQLDRATDESRANHTSVDEEGIRTTEYLERPNIPIRCENGLVKEGAYTNTADYDLPKIGF